MERSLGMFVYRFYSHFLFSNCYFSLLEKISPCFFLHLHFTVRQHEPGSLENYFAALEIRKKMQNEEGVAMSYNNIGTVYALQGKIEASLEAFITRKEFSGLYCHLKNSLMEI